MRSIVFVVNHVIRIDLSQRQPAAPGLVLELLDCWKVLPHNEPASLAANQSQQHAVLIEVDADLMDAVMRAFFGLFKLGDS